MNAWREPAPAPLDGVVARWEWRVFGRDFEFADAVIDAWVPERVGSSEETYFLSVHGDASVKVRDGLMDVKQLLGVDHRGLEHWVPTIKAEFPLSVDDVEAVVAVLGATMPEPTTLEPATGPPTLRAFVDLVTSSADVMVVAVTKHRRHYRAGGCQVESTEISVEGIVTRTITVESTDAAQVVDIVQRLGIDGLTNTSMARGLKTLIGIEVERLLVLDVGTNSVKYHLVERRGDGTRRILVDRADVTRLGEGQGDDGRLAEGPIARTVETVVALVAEAQALGAVEIAAVGTAGLRRAPNRDTLVAAVRERSGVEIDVISGPEEARLAYLAATAALPGVHGHLAVFDSGGGSTQFTFGSDGRVDEQFSLYIGAVRVTEEFGLDESAAASTLDAVFASLAAQFREATGGRRPDGIVAIGGTATNLAAVRHGLATYDPDVVHGTMIDVAELDRQIELYRTRDADARRSIPGLQPARADVILGGACIVRTILTVLGQDSMIVSDRGLRHGVVIDRCGAATRRR